MSYDIIKIKDERSMPEFFISTKDKNMIETVRKQCGLIFAIALTRRLCNIDPGLLIAKDFVEKLK
jgi:hypothetical protein